MLFAEDNVAYCIKSKFNVKKICAFKLDEKVDLFFKYKTKDIISANAYILW